MENTECESMYEKAGYRWEYFSTKVYVSFLFYIMDQVHNEPKFILENIFRIYSSVRATLREARILAR
jgi:hypothetical protein